MTVAQLAERAGVAPHVVRLYARRGLLASTDRSANGYRQFGQRDLDRLRFIRTSASLGFSLNEIGQIIELSQRGKSACPLVREILTQRLEWAQAELLQLQQMHQRMRDALSGWEHLPDRVPTGDDICHLIESVSESEKFTTKSFVQRRLSIGRNSTDE